LCWPSVWLFGIPAYSSHKKINNCTGLFITRKYLSIIYLVLDIQRVFNCSITIAAPLCFCDHEGGIWRRVFKSNLTSGECFGIWIGHVIIKGFEGFNLDSLAKSALRCARRNIDEESKNISIVVFCNSGQSWFLYNSIFPIGNGSHFRTMVFWE